MKNLIKRSITGIVYVGAIIGAVLAGGWWLLSLLILFALLGVVEFNRITNKNFVSNTTTLLDCIGAVLLVTGAYSLLGSPRLMDANMGMLSLLLPLYFCYFIVRFIIQLYVHDGNPLSHLAHSILGQVYVALPLAMLGAFYGTQDKHIVLLMFVLIWLNDTGAFCFGSMFGKHRLFERISPKKSWEGFWGGFILCVIAAGAASRLFPAYFAGFNLWTFVGFGAVVSVFATWGDLVESMIKRSLGVKDSGNILPGHGGILDRIDSLLIVAPTSLLYFLIIIFCA